MYWKLGGHLHHLMWAEAKWVASKHCLTGGGGSLFMKPLSYAFFSSPFLHNMFFFLSHSIQEPPRSSLYILVVVIATGQHPFSILCPVSPLRRSFPGSRLLGFRRQNRSPSNWVLEGRKSGRLSHGKWQPLGAFSQTAARCLPTCGNCNNQVVNERKKISNRQLYTTDILA